MGLGNNQSLPRVLPPGQEKPSGEPVPDESPAVRQALTDLEDAYRPAAREYVESIRRSLPPKGIIGFGLDQADRLRQAFAATYLTFQQGRPLSDAAQEFVLGFHLERPFAPEEVKQGLGLDRENLLERLGEFGVEIGLDPFTFLIFRPGKITRNLRLQQAKRARSATLGESRGAFPTRGSLGRLSLREQFAEGYRSAIGFRALVPIPERLNKAIGRVEAPLIGTVEDTLKLIRGLKPTAAAIDAVARGLGFPAGTPTLRLAQKRVAQGLAAERAQAASANHGALINYFMWQNLLRQSGLKENEFWHLMVEMQTKPHRLDLKRRYPEMWAAARMGEEQMRFQLRAAKELGLEAMELGEVEFTHMLDNEALAQQIAEATRIGAHTTRHALLPALDDGFMAGITTDAGVEFFDIRGKRGSVEFLDQMERKITTPFLQRKRFRRKDGSVMTLTEINVLARKGMLPGFKGRKAKGDVFLSDPVHVNQIRSIMNGRIIERFRTLKTLGRELGRKADEAPEGWLPLRMGSKSPFRKALPEDTVFEPRIKSYIEGVMPYINPEAGAMKTNAFWKTYDGFNRSWVWLNVVPWLGTRLRDLSSNLIRTMSAGVYNPMSYARAAKLMIGVDGPRRSALEWMLKNREHVLDAEAFARGSSPLYRMARGLADMSNIPLMDRWAKRVGNRAQQLFNPDLGAGGRKEQVFRTWNDDNLAVGGARRGTVTLEQLMQEMQSNGIDVSFAESQAFAKSHGRAMDRIADISVSDPKGLLALLYGSKTAELSRNSFNVAANAARKGVGSVKRFAESLAANMDRFFRIAQYLDARIEKGMTADEAVRWTFFYHPNVAKPPTHLDRMIKRAFPFWRWQKFNLPKALQEVTTRPWIPLGTWRFWETMFGQPAHGLQADMEAIPYYLSQVGAQIPTKTEELDGQRITWYTTPDYTVPVYDLIHYGWDFDTIRDTVIYNFSYPLRFMGNQLLHQLTRDFGRSVAIDGREVFGETMFLGNQMPQILANELKSWRPLRALDTLAYRKNLDFPEELQGPTLFNIAKIFLSPISMTPVSEPQSRAMNARRAKAIISGMERRLRSEAERLGREGGDVDGTLRQRQREIKEAIERLFGGDR